MLFVLGASHLPVGLLMRRVYSVEAGYLETRLSAMLDCLGSSERSVSTPMTLRSLALMQV
jgi:predicted membrane chloride channel (bestrophin family)